VTDLVIDASALMLALTGRSSSADSLRASLPARRRHAPHLIDAEVGNVLRRHERAGLISTAEAVEALRAIQVLVDHRYPSAGPLAEVAWALRDNLTFYDGLYVALAARLGAPLLTCDGRLGRAPGLPCRVELV
jgi:predicted nucleic acid-binding protein